MPDTIDALGRRARNAPGWRWSPGMIPAPRNDQDYYDWARVDSVEDDGSFWTYPAASGCAMQHVFGATPDLSDRATLLLTVDRVGELYGGHAWIRPDDLGDWVVAVWDETRDVDHIIARGETAELAAVRALERVSKKAARSGPKSDL